MAHTEKTSLLCYSQLESIRPGLISHADIKATLNPLAFYSSLKQLLLYLKQQRLEVFSARIVAVFMMTTAVQGQLNCRTLW